MLKLLHQGRYEFSEQLDIMDYTGKPVLMENMAFLLKPNISFY